MSYDSVNDEYEYTNQFYNNKPDSPVQSVYYDSEAQDLLVVLDSHWGYLYENVPASVYTNFKFASSKGYFYSKVIKPNHGPGDNLGYGVEVAERYFEAPAMTDVTKATPVAVNVVGTLQPTAAVAPAQVLENLTSLSDDERVTYPHLIHYTVGDGNKVYNHTVDAGSNVHEGKDALEESLDALGLDYTIKGVYISFE